MLDCKGKICFNVFCARLQKQHLFQRFLCWTARARSVSICINVFFARLPGQDLFQSVSTFYVLDCKDEICFNLFEGFLC